MAKGTGKRFPAVAGRRNRMPKEVQSAPQQRTSERPPATPNRGIDHTAVLIGILATVAAAVVGAWILAAWPSLPRWLVIDFLALLVLVIALLLTRGRRRLQWSSAAVGCLVLIGSPAIAWLTQPSETERRVAAYLDSVCHENFWVDESAVCYPRAGDFIVERFDAFNPDRWHARDELPDATAISAQRLSPDAPGIAGSPILVAGRVLAVQRLGGLQQAIQLRPMTVEESVAFMASSEVAAAVSDESDRATLAATSLE